MWIKIPIGDFLLLLLEQVTNCIES